MPPILIVFGGPNGSGKSTITAQISFEGSYVNADEIKSHLNCSDLEAAQIAEATREALLSKKESFAFESVLSTTRNYILMKRAKELGYKVICIYILTKDPDINIERVAARVKKGGHNVQLTKIRERYIRSMALLPNLFSICDECYIYDNSLERSQGEPSLIVSWQNNELRLHPNSIWTAKMLNELCEGIYFNNK